jgi:hypothetical protein
MRWNGTVLCLLSSLQAQSSEFSFHLQSLCSSSRPSVPHHYMDTLWKCKMLQTVGWATSQMMSSHFIHLNAKNVSYNTMSLHNSLQHYLYRFCSIQWLPSHYKHPIFKFPVRLIGLLQRQTYISIPHLHVTQHCPSFMHASLHTATFMHPVLPDLPYMVHACKPCWQLAVCTTA